jgi:hypothetical protein
MPRRKLASRVIIAQLKALIAELESSDNIAEVLALREALAKSQAQFQALQQEFLALKDAQQEDKRPVGIMGSSKFPSFIQVGSSEVTLGMVVRKAFADSGLSVEAWNNLPEVERDAHLQKVVDNLVEPTNVVDAIPPTSV